MLGKDLTTTSHDLHVTHSMMENLNQLPLWVKQVIYLELGRQLRVHFSQESLNVLSAEDTVAYFMPKVTADGEKAILTVKDDTGRILLDAKQRLTVLDICLHHAWSLETTCEIILRAINEQWLFPPSSVKALGTIQYLGNEIRLGEYLVKMDRLGIEQLDQALRTQQYIKEAMQEHVGIANILINLGFITRQDTEGILFLKEESRKPIEKLTIFNKLI